MKPRVAIFASGAGTNAEALIQHFQSNHKATIAMVVCNAENAGVFQRANKHHVPVWLVNKEDWEKPIGIISFLAKENIHFIVLAGFLWRVPLDLIKAFPNKILNLHPALLPKFGGKGMFGMNVHKAVHEAKEKETGITIHEIDEDYDKGKIIFQAKVKLTKEDTPITIALKIHELEKEHFAKQVEGWLPKDIKMADGAQLP